MKHTRMRGSQRRQAEHMKPTWTRKKASNVPSIPRGRGTKCWAKCKVQTKQTNKNPTVRILHVRPL